MNSVQALMARHRSIRRFVPGELDDAMLRAAMLHTTSTMVLGCARGSVREPLEAAARESQHGLEPEPLSAATA